MANFYGELASQVMSDDSELSEMDPNELANLVQDIDDLDANLFNKALKGKGKMTGKSEELETTVSKHVTARKGRVVEDFDEDDMLGDLDDLLSEENTKPKQVSKPEKSKHVGMSNTKLESSSSVLPDNKVNAKVIASLIRLEDKVKESGPQSHKLDNVKHSSAKKRDDWLGLEFDSSDQLLVASPEKNHKLLYGNNSSANDTVSISRANRKPLHSLEGMNEDDLVKSRRVEEKGNMVSTDKPKSSEQIQKSSGSSKLFKSTKDLDKTKQDLEVETKVTFGTYSPSVSSNIEREPRRTSGRKNVSMFDDPLGIFSQPSTPQRKPVNDAEIDKTEKNAAPLTPAKEKPFDTIGFPDKENVSTVQDKQLPLPSDPIGSSLKVETELPSWLGGSAKNMMSQKQQSVLPNEQSSTQVHLQNSLPFIGSALIDQSAILSLKQQEAGLVTALKLRQHEQELINLTQRQAALLEQQEEQMQILLSRQLERQRRLEETLTEQKQRLGVYLEALTVDTIPYSAPFKDAMAPKYVEKTSKGEADDKLNSKVWCDEKKYLEQTIEILKSQHKQELQLLEDSYVRQISLLKTSLEKQEEFYQSENARFNQEYSTRLISLQNELSEVKKSHNEQISHLEKHHKIELQKTREQHEAAMQHFHTIRAMETATLGEASKYYKLLETAVDQLDHKSQDLSNIQEQLNNQQSIFVETKETALQTREKAIQAAQASLEKQRVASDKERNQLFALVSQLEHQLAEQKIVANEKQLQIEQATARIDAKEKALERQRELSYLQLEKERQELQNLKESIMEEKKESLSQLEQERLKLSAEKSQLEILAQIHTTKEISEKQMQAKVNTAVEAARVAYQQAEEQREKLQEKEFKLEEQKWKLQCLEHELTSRAKQLEALSQAAAAMREEGLKSLEEARKLGDEQTARMIILQQQLSDLHSREKRLSQEKVQLSQERTKLRCSSKICSNCKASLHYNSSEHNQAMNLENQRFVDPKVIMMKLVAEKETTGTPETDSFPKLQHSPG